MSVLPEDEEPAAGDGPSDAESPDAESSVAEAPVRYHEVARTYRTLWYTVAVMAVGFGIDLAIGVHGALDHLPGWLFFGAVLLGIHALILYAARATHSLTLTDDEVRVGEEVLLRESIAGLTTADAVTSETVPVLGWPGGRPRGVESVLVRLQDDRDVEIPTRFPDRLRSELGVGVIAPPDGVAIRTATAEDLELLPDIDARAEIVFRVAGYELPAIEFDVDGPEAAAVVFVAGDPAVGFAMVDIVDGTAHLAELAVVPGSMRRGLGTALVTSVCEWASEQGHPRVTLVTYADIPWNGPFYRRLGFAELPFAELGPELRGRRENQTRLGLDEVGRRIVMQRPLGS